MTADSTHGSEDDNSQPEDSSISNPDPRAVPGAPRRRRRRTRIGRLRSSTAKRSSRLLVALLTLIVGGSLLAVGTVHVTTLLVVAPVCILAGALALFVDDRPGRVMLPGLTLALLGLYSLLQSLALPPTWLKALSPMAAEIWHDAFRLTGEPLSRWASVSVDPGASRVEALKWFCYAAVFVASATLSRQKGSQPAAVILIGSALLGGILSVTHGLLGLRDWLGLYHPRMAGPAWAPAPLLNPNNFAGYLNLALFAGMGLLFCRKPLVPRWVTGLTIVILGALVVLSGSRGGVLALVVGFIVAGLAFRSQQVDARKRGRAALPASIPVTALALAALGLAIIGSTPVVWQQLLDETTGKLRIIEYSRPVLRDYLWTGLGRGSFETAFAAYRQEPGHVIAQYAENFVVQWLVEWGLPVAVLALAGLIWAFRLKRLGFARDAMPTGIGIAVGILLLQNLVDLATEVMSVGVAMAVLLGALIGGATYTANLRKLSESSRLAFEPKREGFVAPDPASERRIPSRWAAAISLACLLLGGLIELTVLRTGRPDAIDQRDQLAKALTSLAGKPRSHPDYATLQASVRTALLRHPADPYAPVVAALLARESGSSPLAWLNQALRRDPLNARAHLLLADTLATHGKWAQALFELKRVTALAPELRQAVIERAIRWTPDFANLMRIVPEGSAGIVQFNALAQRLAGLPEHHELRKKLLQHSLDRSPNDPQTNTIFAQDLFGALADKTSACQGESRDACEQRLRQHITTVLRNTKDRQLSTQLSAQLLAFDDKHDEAERLLAEHCPFLPNPVQCGAMRVNYALKLSDRERFEAAADAYIASACATPASCSNAYNWLGNLESGRNNLPAALARYERAAQESPSMELWLRVADIALRLGRIGRAHTALTAARRLGHTEGPLNIDKRLEELQRARLLEDSRVSPAGKR